LAKLASTTRRNEAASDEDKTSAGSDRIVSHAPPRRGGHRVNRRETFMKFKTIVSVALSMAMLAVALPAAAQQKYPTKPIRMINPYPPGGAVDIAARIVIEPMREILGQPIVLENKPGGFGMIAGQEMTRAPADGYTLVFGQVNTHAIWPILHRAKFPFDFRKETLAVTSIADVPSFVAVTAKDFPHKTLKEALDYAKANPGKVRFSSAGIGSFPHFDMEVLARRAGVDIRHIPGKGGAAIVQDLSTGDAQMAVVNVASAAPLVRSGTIRALAVIADKRLDDFPDVPTLAEVGYPNVGTHHWLGIFARTGTPDHVVAALQKAASEALKRPATIEALRKQAMRPFPSESPEAARKWLASELDTWEKIIAEVNIKVE
jgi:tripartite-type tricarboxylate transporter receptor subunit TctC